MVVVAEKVTTAPPPSSAELGVVFSSLQTRLRNYLRKRVEEAVVEDLLQDIFLKALAAISAKKAPKNLPGWLYTVARTSVVDYYRVKRLPEETLQEDHPEASQADEESLQQELATCLRPLAQQLPEIYRHTLLATDFDGRTMATVAKEQGLSLSAIKSRASRARAMLKEKLLDCCDVEIANGRISDYRCQSSTSCGDNCT